MRLLTAAFLLIISATINATPISYVFGGTITQTSNSRFLGELAAGGADPNDYDWWPEVGDRYQGFITYDLDELIYADPDSFSSDSCYWGASICGGLVNFRIKLGDLWLTYNFNNSPSAKYGIDWRSETGARFTAWGYTVERFDSFNFDHGSFSGVENQYFDGMAGKADLWVKVPEPTSLGLCALGIGLLIFRRRLINPA